MYPVLAGQPGQEARSVSCVMVLLQYYCGHYTGITATPA